MIYLLKSAEYENDKFFFSLKIGYTNDEETDVLKNRRLSTYLAHHRSISLICIIPNGTEEQEKKLHCKFKEYLWKGDEWYYYNDEIVNYMKSVTPKELDILSYNKYINYDNSKLMNSKKFRNIKCNLREILSFAYKRKDINYAILDAFHNIKEEVTESSVLEYLSSKGKDFSKYYELQNKIKTGNFCENKESNDKFNKFFEKYKTLTKIEAKLKLIVETNFNNYELNYLLDQIDIEIDNYLVELGINKIKSCGYNITDMKTESDKAMFNFEIIKNSIYSEFIEGSKVSLSKIKEKLSDIYNSIGYKATPKAKDLEEWFELKTCKFIEVQTDGTKKSVHGYNLIKKLK